MRYLLIALTLGAPLLMWAPTATAQTEVDAHDLFEQGNEHLRQGLEARSSRVRRRELQEALRLFHQSLQVTRSRSVVFNVAYCYEELGRLEDSWAYYTEYLAFEDLDDNDRSEARRHLEGLRPRVALVEVSSTPAGATVFVDRTDLSARGVTPATIATRPGDRMIILQLEGHEPGSQTATAVLGERQRVEIELQARPATVHVLSEPEGAEVRFDDENGPVAGLTPLETSLPAGPHRVYVSLGDRFGREVFDAPPGGEVSIPVTLGAPTSPGFVDISVDVPGVAVSVDGEEVGLAPVQRLRLTPGRHRISIEGDAAHQGWSDVVEVGPDHRVRIRVHLGNRMPQRRFGPWPTVSMVLASALAVAGAATGGWALAMYADFRDIEETCNQRFQSCGEGTALREEALELEQRIRPMSIATDVLLGTAGAIAIVSFALMLLNREVEDVSRVQIGVAPTPGGALASVGFGLGLVSSP